MKLLCPSLTLFLLHTVFFYTHAQQPNTGFAQISSKDSLPAAISGLPSAQASPFKFEHLTATEGLSHNKVQCVLQDKQAYMWFGTVHGLNRYDGYTFKVFENIPGDSLSIANDNIISLYQDKNDLIWIGTSTVLSCYNPGTETFRNYNLPALHGEIHDFKEDENGILWIATGFGLFSFDRKTQQETYHATVELGRDNIHSILKNKNKDIFWLGTERGIKRFDKKTGSVKTYPLPFPAFNDISKEITHNLIEDKSGNLWISTSEWGVYQFNLKTEKFTAYTVNIPDPSSPKSRVITQIMEDADGKIWMGGEGLAFFDPLTKSKSFCTMNTEDAEGIPGKIRALFKDKNGIYWFGTERGIAKYDPKLYSFKTVKPNYPYTLQTANTILEDKEHKFWVGNYTGLGSMDPNTGIYTNENQILGTGEINSLFSSLLDKDGSMWFGSVGCLFHIYKKKSEDKLRADKILLPVARKVAVTVLAFNVDGILWGGTKGAGLFRYDPFLKNFKLYQGKEADQDLFSLITIRALHAISADSLLIGTEGRGLILMQTKEEKFEKIKFEKYKNRTEIDYSMINAIYEDNKKNIWIGTETGGLWQTNFSLSKFRNYSVKDGLQSMNITQIVEDNEGQIWLNTNLGLEIVDPAKSRFVHYSEKDGLSINQPAYLIKKSSGDLMRVDLNGLHIFHSSSINLNKEIPPVYINHLQVLDKSIPVYGDTVIYLKYYENYVSFDYVALNYTQSFKNRYAYRLEGLNKNWIYTRERRFSYFNIGADTYTFEVKACNNNGIWNEKPARLTLIISPPWWRTRWFYILCILVISATIYILFQYRLRQKLKAYELRNTISRDLHDEVGSTLSSIGFLSSMALNDVDNNNVKIHSTLNSISESSHKMLDAMNDIIWNIQPENDTLENIIARMLSFASELLEARKISLHFKIADNLKHLHLGVAVRHDFFVIYKEAVNNLAKYSEASEAHINLEFHHPCLILTIRDNGKGFDPEKIKSGNGLKNMESRAKKIGAVYHLHTVSGGGTTITLQVNLHDNVGKRNGRII